MRDPQARASDIIVVDDGARAGLAQPVWQDHPLERRFPDVQWVDGIKPFVYARNINVGIAAAGREDVLLMGDDVRFITGSLWDLAREASVAGLGACSAGVVGTVCNPNQHPVYCRCERGGGRMHVHPDIRPELRMLAFVCVYIPRRTLDQIGPLDERFAGYGYDDNDYCRRIVEAGGKLGVSDAAVVEHASLPSSYRTRPDIHHLMQANRALYQQKYAEA
jgi:GT2 family glycosyltransferase